MVSAWATNNGVVLGQVKTEENPTRSRQFLGFAEAPEHQGLSWSPSTPWAARSKSAADIQEAGANYLLAVKDNQPTLSAEVTAIFEHCRREPAAFGVDFNETHNTGHGRTEIRRCWTTNMSGALVIRGMEGLAEFGD